MFIPVNIVKTFFDKMVSQTCICQISACFKDHQVFLFPCSWQCNLSCRNARWHISSDAATVFICISLCYVITPLHLTRRE